ncbi:MAG TPA: nicotinate-nucleotide adenylyltransferase [Rhabdochlamydiaceae bacterium]|nr:nicotinate-nucleotide adenylyltransferase [Rhabdochlamydiaceae bacterium]
MKKIALFGGTFDPIHLGHLNLAVQMQEIHKLDEVLFCPAYSSPLKQNDLPKAGAKQRRAMVTLAIGAVPGFSILDDELERAGPSFTIDTMRHLIQSRPKAELFLILGELKGLEKWKEIDQLLSLAQPLIGARQGNSRESVDLNGLSGASRKALQQGMTPISIMEISSTKIRERLKQKKYCGHLVPEKVLNYIYEHKLYT